MIDVENLSFRYSGKKAYALRQATFQCKSDGITVVVGRSGVGKSTLVSLLAGIYVPEDSVVGELEGKILIDGRPPTWLCGPEVVSWVPQTPILLDHLSVLENVVLPLTIDNRCPNDKEKARIMLKQLGLQKYEDSRPRELSGGMKTRVSLLRALISMPKYLFLDEPFISLDLRTRLYIYRFIQTLRHGANTTTVLTTHNIPEATLLADRIIVLQQIDDKTVVRELSNEAKLVHDEGTAVCLEKARQAAVKIEEQLFSVAEEGLSA